MHIQLTKPHTHAGFDYQPGARLEVSETVGDWLLAQGAAVIHDDPPDPPGTVTLSAPPKRHRKRHHNLEDSDHGE